ncbi:MAG: hypothetical protein OXE52_04935 [Chloroflexi bacterium]|nr:hypothetical protein [Chloroflexota bacterium]
MAEANTFNDVQHQINRHRALLNNEERVNHQYRNDRLIAFLKGEIADFEDAFNVMVDDLSDGNLRTAHA